MPGESTPVNGNGGQVSATVLQVVLDKFLAQGERNSQSSSGITQAIDSMAANVREMTEHLNALERQIVDEQLGSVLTEAVDRIKLSFNELQDSMQNCGVNNLGYLVTMCRHLEYQNQDPKVLAEGVVKLIKEEGEYQENLTWILGLVGWIREHRFIITFLAGGMAIWLYLKAGVDTIGYIKLWLGGN